MNVLKAFLRTTEMSQGDLAGKAGIHVTTLSRFITGKRKPSLRNLRKIAKATGITLDRLARDL